MALLDTLSIPSGLEALYFKAIQTKDFFGTVVAGFTTPPSSYKKKKALHNRSLFLAWHGIYNALTSTQKSDWDNIWGGTPFGSHTGAGGWPGSAFSAYVYVNASRRKRSYPSYDDAPTASQISWGAGFFDSVAGDEADYLVMRHIVYNFTATSNDAASSVLDIGSDRQEVFFGKIKLLHKVGSSWVDILSNGDFSNGLTGWDKNFGGVHAAFGGCVLRRTTILGQTVTLVAGDQYSLQLDVQSSPFV